MPAHRSLPMVEDCGARYPLCGARCCSLEIRLTDEEFASGRYRTASHRPHYLERGDHGMCVYWQDRAEACGIYETRPEACRNYTCFGDSRFWRDFDGRVPNRKGIHALVHRGLMPPRDD